MFLRLKPFKTIIKVMIDSVIDFKSKIKRNLEVMRTESELTLIQTLIKEKKYVIQF